MKKLLFVISVSFVFMCISCNETQFSVSEPITSKEELQIVIGDNIPFVKNPYDTEIYLNVSEDPDDERINRSLYEVSLILRDILKTKECNEVIASTVKANFSSTMNINDIAIESNLKSSNLLLSALRKKLKTLDLTHISNNPLKSGVVEEYVPAVYVPNVEIADFEKSPIICPGIEVNSELPGAEQYEDYIVGWIYDAEGKLVEFIFNEETAMQTTHPIYIIDNACSDMMSVSSDLKPEVCSADPLKSVSYKFSVALYEHNLDYRFESSGRSEYCIHCMHIWPDGAHHAPYKKLTSSIDVKIAEVNKDDIGKEFNLLYYMAAADYTESIEDHGIFWNTYEKDWYRSPKSLGTPSLNGTTLYFNGNMHYASDWYAFKPEGIMDSKVDLLELYNSEAIWYSSAHAEERLWKKTY